MGALAAVPCSVLGPGRGRSSVGRAPDLHSGGRRFDSDRLHHVRNQGSGTEADWLSDFSEAVDEGLYPGSCCCLLFLDSVKRVLAAVEAPGVPAMGRGVLVGCCTGLRRPAVGEQSSATSVRLAADS
jgi:hypothetical protein